MAATQRPDGRTWAALIGWWGHCRGWLDHGPSPAIVPASETPASQSSDASCATAEIAAAVSSGRDHIGQWFVGKST